MRNKMKTDEIIRSDAINYALQKAERKITELQGHLYTSYAVIVFMTVLAITLGYGPQC